MLEVRVGIGAADPWRDSEVPGCSEGADPVKPFVGFFDWRKLQDLPESVATTCRRMYRKQTPHLFAAWLVSLARSSSL